MCEHLGSIVRHAWRVRGVRGTHTLIHKNRGFPASPGPRLGLPLAELASEDALNASNERFAAKGTTGS